MNAIEKRREVRRAGAGSVRVRCDEPERMEIEGRLIDVSPSGFRMAHGCASLEAGRVVEFAHIEARGYARVMWNRILAERVETGFLIIAG